MHIHGLAHRGTGFTFRAPAFMSRGVFGRQGASQMGISSVFLVPVYIGIKENEVQSRRRR